MICKIHNEQTIWSSFHQVNYCPKCEFIPPKHEPAAVCPLGKCDGSGVLYYNGDGLASPSGSIECLCKKPTAASQDEDTETQEDRDQREELNRQFNEELCRKCNQPIVKGSGYWLGEKPCVDNKDHEPAPADTPQKCNYCLAGIPKDKKGLHRDTEDGDQYCPAEATSTRPEPLSACENCKMLELKLGSEYLKRGEIIADFNNLQVKLTELFPADRPEVNGTPQWSDERIKYLRASISDMSDEELRIELAMSAWDLSAENPNNIKLAKEKLATALRYEALERGESEKTDEEIVIRPEDYKN